MTEVFQAVRLNDASGSAGHFSQFRLLGVVMTANPTGTVTLAGTGLEFTASAAGWNAAPNDGLQGYGGLFHTFSDPADIGKAIAVVQPL